MTKIIRSSRLEVFCRNGVVKNFAKFTGKHLCQSLFFNKVAGLRPATLLKKRLWHRCFPVNFAKLLRTPSFTKYLWWLLLNHYNGKVLLLHRSSWRKIIMCHIMHLKVSFRFFVVSGYSFFKLCLKKMVYYFFIMSWDYYYEFKIQGLLFWNTWII